MADSFDLVVIGGGPGGYVAAIRAAQLGMSVACVEKRETLGGTCLNVGCIPSKALLHSSHQYETVNEHLGDHGIKADRVSLDLKAMMERKRKVVDENVKGIAYLFKKNKVESIAGTGRITGSGTVEVTPPGKDGKNGKPRALKARNILIATGSAPSSLPGIDIDEKRIVSSTGALELSEVPKKLVVIGGGIIGLEMGSVWRRLGSEVTVVEFMDVVLPGWDADVSKQVGRILGKQGLDIRTKTKVTEAKATKSGVTLKVEPRDGGESETLKADIVLVAVGRSPYTEGLGLDEAGVKTDDKGFIQVDDDLQTDAAGIFAIGDVIGGAMLAHKAEEEGIAAVETMAGQAGHVNYRAIPGVVYTWPEIATVGRSEEALKKDGVDYKVGKFPISANSRARCTGDTEGFVKILADAKTDRVLGAHMVAAHAGELIQEIALLIEFGGAAEDLARTSHAHPGLYEAVKEAALALGDGAIHV